MKASRDPSDGEQLQPPLPRQDSLGQTTEPGQTQEDPVLGTCLVFHGRRFWLWGRIAFLILFTLCSLVLAALGESGFRSSLAHNNLILALWPLMLVLSVVFGWGIVLALLDAIGPRYAELRVGDNGFAMTKGGDRADVYWSSVRAIAVDTSFWRQPCVRVTLDHRRAVKRNGQSQVNESLLIRTDLMSLKAQQIAVEMSAARARGHDLCKPSSRDK